MITVGAETGSQTVLQSSDIREYPSDYVRGYPNWNNEINGGKLLLERYVGEGNDKIIFKVPDGSKEIMIPAKDISEARIISKNGHQHDDLMIEISYKDQRTGKLTKPVFNLTDDVIRGVAAGINELVADEKGMKRLLHTKIVSDIKYCTNCGHSLASDAKFCSNCGIKQ